MTLTPFRLRLQDFQLAALDAAIRNALIERNMARLNGNQAEAERWQGYIDAYRELVIVEDLVAGGLEAKRQVADGEDDGIMCLTINKGDISWNYQD